MYHGRTAAAGGRLSAFGAGDAYYRELRHRDAEGIAASTAYWPFHDFAAMAIDVVFKESADWRFFIE